MKITPYLQAMRLERWPRSLAIFIGTGSFFFLYPPALKSLATLDIIWKACLAFVLTWGISTANYIINEIVDAPYDIHHPTKRLRPYVRGEVQPLIFLSWQIFLAVFSLIAAYFLFSLAFFFSLLVLLFAGFIYNIKPIRTKDIPFLDSISESANNPIRFLIGWFAFAPPSLWPPISLLLAWWAFGNFLMVAKRLSEFRFLKDKAGMYRASLKKYTRLNLLVGMIISILVFYTCFLYFTFSYGLLSFIIPGVFLIFFVAVIFKKTLREKEVMEEPERLIQDKRFLGLLLLIVASFILAILFERVGR